MKSFTGHNKIIVTEEDNPLKGICGTIARIRMGDNGAWVNMESIPEGTEKLFPFSNDKEDRRCNHTLLYPDQCQRM